MTEPARPWVRLSGVVVDLHARRVRRDDGSEVALRQQAVEVLCELALQPGEVVDKRRLIDRVWPGMVVTDDSLVQAVGDIRRAIGDERHQVLQTVPRRGYRLIVTVEEAGRPAPAAPPGAATPIAAAPAEAGPAAASADADERAPGLTPLPDRSPASPPPARARRWAAAGLAALVLAAAASTAGWLAAGRPAPGGAPDRPPIAVLPFTDARESGADPMVGRGFSEELALELARNADVPVIATTSALAAADQGGDLRTVADRLKARYVVDGSLRREGDSLRLRVRLVDGRDGQVAWTAAENVPASDVYRVRSEWVERIATTLQSTVRTREKRLVLQRPPASLDNYEQALRGIALKHRITPQANAEARRLLEGVLQRDPEFAPAWAYLGMVEGLDWLNQFSGPRRAELLTSAIGRLERARQLDPRLSASHLGLTFLLQYQGRHAEAVTAGRRCLELAPSDAECRMFLSFALVFDGQAAEAIGLAERAMALSPLPPGYMHTQHGVALWAVGRLAEAVQAQERCLQHTPRFVVCRIRRMLTLAEMGRVDEALADLALLRAAGVGDRLLETQAFGSFAASAAPLAERGRAALGRVLGAALAAR